jgi:hypothetical protein
VLGRFTIDVNFTDSSIGDPTKSVKTVSLAHATEYSSGKVAVVTGTVGTAVINVDCNTPAYTDSSGAAVVFSSISRVAFSATGANMVRCASDQLDGVGYAMTLYSRANQIAVSESIEDNEFEIGVVGTAGTSSYTIILYGS